MSSREHASVGTPTVRAHLPLLGSDGRTVIVAMDHGMAAGHVEGLERPRELLRAVMAADPDGLILNPGMGRIAGAAGRTPWFLAADAYGRSTLPAGDGPTDMHAMLWTAGDAMRFGAAGLKVLLVFGREDLEAFRENLQGVAHLLSEAHELGIPVMVETTLWGDRVHPMEQRAGRSVLDAARIGFELGADALKIPLPDDLGCLRELVTGVDVPVVLMGGPAADGEAVLKDVASALAAGAHGVALGRNTWKRPAPAAFVRALVRVVHGDESPAAAWRAYREAERALADTTS